MNTSTIPAPPPVARCGCGRTFDKQEWQALPFIGVQSMPDDVLGELSFELRNCACGSTISPIRF